MPVARTLSQFAEAVQRTANVHGFTEKHPLAYVYDLVNRGLGALNRITAQVNPEFRPVGSQTITTDGSNTVFPLSASCRSVISVEYTDGDGRKTWLIPYELHERAALTEPLLTSSALRAQHYRVIGTNIELLPRPPDGHTALIWFATTPQLSDPSESVDVFDRLDDYVIWWAAREIAMEREDWERHDRLTDKIRGLEAEIMVMARQRDVSHPARVVDLDQADRYGRYVRRGWR